ncbi:GNAT family N-acetyltransferase [Natrinema salifodinae]|uniref:Acetyltransferase, GNAT family n=1 Tax=Natrinema salifodinae TaxID=1202768 RepID=A0A1I0N5Q9_9EURY|nr:GNAT family N-acetyltransferase [Natrinema salifodinae]SEV96464.1 Acetyltransferase, GNAT family [Natrinema salifodinae]
MPPSNPRPTIDIEPAARGDLDALADMWVRLARDQRTYGSAIRADANRETMRETLAAHQVNDGLLVARLGGRGARAGTATATATGTETDSIVGFVSFSIERGSLDLDTTRGLLSNIYVDPAYRDRGIGAALLEAAEDALAERGADVMLLEVMADNEAARRFYRRQGYDSFRVTMGRPLEERDDRGDRSENDTHSKEDG